MDRSPDAVQLAEELFLALIDRGHPDDAELLREVDAFLERDTARAMVTIRAGL